MTDTARHTILYVESSAHSRPALVASLCDHADCAFARTEDVVERLRSNAWDAYVLDCCMTAWSGPLLCREIRKRDPHCPVVVCGTPTSHVTENRAFSAGASAYVAELDLACLSSTLVALLAAGDVDSQRAQQESERVLADELHRCMTLVTASRAAPLLPDSLERTVRARTFRAFIDGGGTRAHFGRWWAKQFPDHWLTRAPGVLQ